MPYTTDNILVEGLSDIKSFRTQTSVQASAATTTTLTLTSEYKWIYTGSVAGQIVQLPNATTLSNGHTFEIHNNGTQAVTINDAASVLVYAIKSGFRVEASLQDNSTTAGTWSINVHANTEAVTQVTQYGGTTSFFNDFLYDTFHTHSLIQSVVLNGGTGVINDGTNMDNTSSGLIIIGTGTSNNATGKSCVYSSTALTILAGGQTLEWRVRLPTLSAASPRYDFKAGTQDSTAVGDPANGIYFQYSDNLNSGQWIGITRNGSTSTTVNSTIAVVANTWYRLRYVVNTAGTLVTFYVNDIPIGTSIVNIPTTNETRFQASIEKKTTSTSTRIAVLDWYQYSVLR
jgi:hypothetical protein